MASTLERRKSIDSATFGDMKASGIASPFLEMDRHGDLMLPGCYKGAAEEFVSGDAVVMLNHYEPLPIGICTKAAEGDRGLEVDWVYHTHEKAVDSYKVAKERFQHGKGTGLSVGFRMNSAQSYEEFENGQQLLDYLQKEGFDLSQVKNVDKIRARSRWCSAIKRVDELFEFSQVCVGAAYSALTDQIKHALGGDGSLAGLALPDHLDVLLASVGGVNNRLKSLCETKAEEGRNVGKERLTQAKSLHELLGETIELIEKGYATPLVGDMGLAKARSAAFLLENN